MAQSMFDKYGRYQTFSTVVSNFYQKVLDSQALSPYFEGIRMERLISHQTNFISRVLGGPDKYEGRDLAEAHADFKISAPHFLEATELLEESLEEAGVTQEDITTIISIISNLKNQIVSA